MQHIRLPRRLGYYERGDAIFVGPGSPWSNAFQRAGISLSRSLILFRAWFHGEVTPGILRAARFSEAEIIALERRRRGLIRQLPQLQGCDVRCICPPWETWCHGDMLIRAANGGRP